MQTFEEFKKEINEQHARLTEEYKINPPEFMERDDYKVLRHTLGFYMFFTMALCLFTALSVIILPVVLGVGL